MEPNEKSKKEIYKEWNNDPANWKLGFIYFNPKDKRVLPPKRSGLGWTTNFANPISIIVLLAIVAFFTFVGIYINFGFKF